MTWWDTKSKRFIDQMFTGAEGWNHPSRAYVRSRMTDGKTLLDMGCGSGAELEGLLIEGRQVNYVGVDFTDNCLSLCIDKFPNHTFIKGNLRDLQDFEDGNYNYVLVRHVLEHNREYPKIIKEALRLANDRVFIVLFRWSEWEPDSFWDIGDETVDGSINLGNVRAIIAGYGCAKVWEHKIGNNYIFEIFK